MVIDMSERKLVTPAQLRRFLEGTTEVEFRGCGQDEDRYRHIGAGLRRLARHALRAGHKASDAVAFLTYGDTRCERRVSIGSRRAPAPEGRPGFLRIDRVHQGDQDGLKGVYAHIPQRFASQVNAFCAEHLNPYVTFHRPCLFAQEILDQKGKITKRYPQQPVMPALEKLARIEKLERFLKPGITLAALRRAA
jgi:hypothetical protein